MGLKIDFDPTPKKAVAIAILLFFEALLIPMQAHLQQTQQMPNEVQILTWFVVAIVQLITYFLAFLGYEKSEEGP